MRRLRKPSTLPSDTVDRAIVCSVYGGFAPAADPRTAVASATSIRRCKARSASGVRTREQVETQMNDVIQLAMYEEPRAELIANWNECRDASRLTAQVFSSTLTISPTTVLTSFSSSPSAITRIKGSVPDLRIRRRPLFARRASPSWMAVATSCDSSGLAPARKRTFFRICGSGSKRCVASLAFCFDFGDHGEHLQRRDQAVAGGGEVAEHEVARLFAADVEAVFAHVLDDVTVADGGARELQAHRVQDSVRGSRFDITVATTPPPFSVPAFDHERAIRARIWSPSMMLAASRRRCTTRSASPSSAMPRSARLSFTLLHIALGGGRAAFAVDVEAVGIDADLDDFGAEFPQHFGRDAIGGAVGAVDDDAQTVQAQMLRERALGEFDVARLGVVDALGAAEFGRLGEPLLRGRCPSCVRSRLRRRRTICSRRGRTA